jgi:hypothetical protein
LGKAGGIGLTTVGAPTKGHERGKLWVLQSYMLGHTSGQYANVVSILSHERPHLSLPSKPLLGGSWILKIFKFKQPGYCVFNQTLDESNFKLWVFETKFEALADFLKEPTKNQRFRVGSLNVSLNYFLSVVWC